MQNQNQCPIEFCQSKLILTPPTYWKYQTKEIKKIDEKRTSKLKLEYPGSFKSLGETVFRWSFHHCTDKHNYQNNYITF